MQLLYKTVDIFIKQHIICKQKPKLFYIMDYILLFLVILCVLTREMYVIIKISKIRALFIQQKDIDISEIKIPSLSVEVIKRIMDIVISLFVCLTILPLLYLILGTVIKLTSAGPIIFRQNRIGIFGIMFPCYKFRSMYQNSEEKAAERGDARVTPVGRFIRKTHLDEFPQFYNVLIGDMSLVGPRPTIRFVADGLDQDPQYIYRVLVRPGITGVSQINGRQDDLVRMLKFDFEYLKSQSLWNDIKIILQTLKFQDDSY